MRARGKFRCRQEANSFSLLRGTVKSPHLSFARNSGAPNLESLHGTRRCRHHSTAASPTDQKKTLSPHRSMHCTLPWRTFDRRSLLTAPNSSRTCQLLISEPIVLAQTSRRLCSIRPFLVSNDPISMLSWPNRGEYSPVRSTQTCLDRPLLPHARLRGRC
jgi:hypothetical protein